MKQIIRRIIAFVVRLTAKHACKTYGDVAELSSGPCKRCVGMRVNGRAEREVVEKEKYYELIYAVGNAFPGETRHETALRYIRQAETHANISNNSAQTSNSEPSIKP